MQTWEDWLCSEEWVFCPKHGPVGTTVNTTGLNRALCYHCDAEEAALKWASNRDKSHARRVDRATGLPIRARRRKDCK